jgi:N-sulfoglucosamine sulfohydrolase
MLLHRVPEEFYDFTVDPSGLHNLIADPNQQAQIAEARKDMLLWMERTKDPLLEAYRARITSKP